MLRNKPSFPFSIINDFTEDSENKTILSIPVSDKKITSYPLSSAQNSIFIMEQTGTTGTLHNMPVSLEIEGPLDISRLSMALLAIVERHEALRTSFDFSEGLPVENINSSIRFKKGFRKSSEDEVEFILDDFVKPFNINKAPLFKVELVRILPEKHILLLDFHNIIFDGFSLKIFIKELSLLYSGETLPPLTMQYRDFALWQKNLQSSDYLKAQEDYWLTVFSRELSDFELPFIPSRRTGHDFQGQKAEVSFEDTDKIIKFCKEKNTDICSFFFTSLNILMARYSSCEDIVMAFPVTGRKYDCFKDIIGLFTNILPVRNFPESNKSFLSFLSEVKENLLKSHNNQDYHIEDLIEKLKLKRTQGRHPLFDVLFLNEKEDTSEFNINGLKIKSLYNDRSLTAFPLSFGLVEKENDFDFYIEYQSSLFKDEVIERMSEHFVNMIKYIISHAECKIQDIEIMGEEERNKIFYDFNRTKSEYNIEKNIVELFEEKVKEFPDNIALVFKDKKMTYEELNRKANQLAVFLREKGVKPDDIVGIMVEPSLEMIVGTMGILKSGAAYMPIDARYPTERINYMFNDSNASILLGQKELFEKTKNLSAEFIDLHDEKYYSGKNVNLNISAKPHNAAYVIYTSGSTGKPKGTLIEHSSLTNLSLWQRDSVELTSLDRVSKYAGFGFDVSVGEIFPTLITGASLYIVSDEYRMSPVDLNEYYETNNITLAFLPTQFCEQFMELVDNKSLRVLDVAGEKLKHYRKRNYKLLNKYGPTEYTVYTTCFTVDKPYGNIPIGVPVSNTSIYILDKNNKLQPLEVPGELCISGAGLARGYLNRPDLTKEKFIENPFDTSTRMYRTGDLARWLPDGNIEYLGRMDHQVKIRGFRIELEEIEHIILKGNNIIKAVVIDRDDADGNKYLCAYIVAQSEIDCDEIRKRLSAELPDYMIPQYIIQIETLPLNPNGKLDRKALPEPEKHTEPFVASRNKTENIILKVWQDVLDVKHIGINDNFFALGGHSLKAIKVVAKLQMDFEITVNDIFKYQTIGELSENVINRKDNFKSKLHSLKERVVIPKRDEYFDRDFNEYVKNSDKYKTLDFSLQKHYEHILLTGSTGYLGIHLLMEILRETKSNVYLIVRGKSDEDSAERLEKKFEYYFGINTNDYKERIHILKGNLSEDRLGLEENVYTKLSETVECIIHSAASVKHYGHYDDFYKNNVIATKNLLAFSLEGRNKDFNYISTISVAEGSVEGKTMALYTEECVDIGQKLGNFYGQTKLEAEKCVIAAREQGIRANIFRIGNIVYHSVTGLFQENREENAFFSMIKSYVNLGIVPKEEPFDFTFVDYVSKAVILLCNKINLNNEIYHIINHRENLADILLSKELNLNLEKLSMDKFIDYLYKNDSVPSFKDYIENLMLHKGWLSDEVCNMHIVSDRTNLILKNLNFQWPSVDPLKMREIILSSLEGRISFLRDIPLFSGLSHDVSIYAAGLGREEYYTDESYLLWEGDVNRNFSIIIEGNVEIVCQSRAGWPGTICIFGEGEFLGEESLWGDKPASFTAEVFMGEMKVLSFKYEDLIKIIKEYPEFAINLVKEMANRVKKLQKIIVEMG